MITIDVIGFFSGGVMMCLMLLPAAWGFHRERGRYIERVYGERRQGDYPL